MKMILSPSLLFMIKINERIILNNLLVKFLIFLCKPIIEIAHNPLATL
jgi:hypothetical protein